MAGSGEVLATQVALTEGDDIFSDDPRDGKKKKFKPFQKMRNFFRGGSSKKRFKVVEGGEGSVKSQSTGALHSQRNSIDEEDDDGGFGRFRKSGLAGSRSISEDSIFKPDAQKEALAPVGVLAGQAVSMERINNDFQSELFSKLRGRQSDSDIDEGLPYSPNQNSNIFDAAMKATSSKTGRVKSGTQDSEQSLISVDGSEEDLFESKWSSGVASVKQAKTASTGSTESLDMEISDFEAIQKSSGHALSSDAAKHRISIKPKTRRLSSKKSFKAKEKPMVQTTLSNVKEEPGNQSPVKANKQEEQMKQSAIPLKTVISTTIPVGNPPDANIDSVAKSEPKDIPQPMKGREDLDSGRMSRSLSPLSTSPVSQSMLQDVKLRSSRPLSGKYDNVDIKKEGNQSELSAFFNKAKRFSRKYDADGKIIDSNADSVKTDVKNVVSKPEVSVNKTIPQKDDTKKDVAMSVSTSTPKDSYTNNASPTSPSGVSYVLKKEPLRSGSKPVETQKSAHGVSVKTDTVKQTVDSNTSSSVKVTKTEEDAFKNFDSGYKSVTVSNVNPFNQASGMSQSMYASLPRHATKSAGNSLAVTNTAISPKTGSPEKLPSPREDYKLKRQSRSKTLPVSKELVDKAEGLEKANQKPSRAGSPPILTSSSRTNIYENKPIQPKRMSWAPSTATTANAPPSWVTRSKQKEIAIEKQPEIAKEVKIGVKSTTESKTGNETKIFKTSEMTETKPVIDHAVNQPVKPWAKSVTAKPFEKPVIESNAKPLLQSSTAKPFSQSMRGNVSTQPSTGQKPPVPSAASKPLSQSVRPTLDNKSSNLATSSNGKTSGFERSFSQKTGVNKPAVETTKPVNTQLTVKPLGNVNTNSTKTDNKDNAKPGVGSVPDSRKTFLNQENNKKIESESKKDIISSPAKSAFERSKVGGSTSTSTTSKADTNTGVPDWKKALAKKSAMTQQVNIEIIDKQPDKKKPDVKKMENKVEEKTPVSIALREKVKPAPEKCSDNRSSKVLDMVKNFQKFQVT